MYYHVYETVRPYAQEPFYRHVKTYKSYTALLNWLKKNGAPVWILNSRSPGYAYATGAYLGGFAASYYNTGGFGIATMPSLPLKQEKG